MLENNNIRKADYYEESLDDDFKEATNKKNTRSSLWASIADKLIQEIDTHPFLSTKKEDKAERNKFLILCTNYIMCRYRKLTGFNPSYSIDPETFHFESKTIWDYCPIFNDIMDAVLDSYRNYKPETGEFSHYFNKIIRERLSSAQSSNSTDDRLFGTIPEKDKRAMRIIYAYVNKYCKDNNVSQDEIPQMTEKIAAIIYENTDLGKDKINSMLNIMYKTKFVAGDAPQSDDDATSAMSNQEDPNQNVEEMIEQTMILKKYGIVIDEVVKETQARTIPKVKAYATNLIYKAFYEKYPDYIAELEEFEFFDKEVVKEIEKKKTILTNQEIADRFHVSGASISKISNTFEDRFKEKCKKAGLTWK